MATSKRQYFTQLEKNIVIELVSKYENILESKKNDYRSIKQKSNTWQLITSEFNAQADVSKRDDKQIKKCWENIKTRQKANKSKERRERLLTGGGPEPKPPEDSSEVVAGIISSQTEPLKNPFDDDAGPDDCLSSASDEGEASKCQKSHIDQPSTSTAGSHKRKSTSATATSAKRPCDKVSPAQYEVLSMQEEEHQLQMELLRTQIKNCNEEHQLKMDILNLHKRALERQLCNEQSNVTGESSSATPCCRHASFNIASILGN